MCDTIRQAVNVITVWWKCLNSLQVIEFEKINQLNTVPGVPGLVGRRSAKDYGVNRRADGAGSVPFSSVKGGFLGKPLFGGVIMWYSIRQLLFRCVEVGLFTCGNRRLVPFRYRTVKRERNGDYLLERWLIYCWRGVWCECWTMKLYPLSGQINFNFMRRYGGWK